MTDRIRNIFPPKTIQDMLQNMTTDGEVDFPQISVRPNEYVEKLREAWSRYINNRPAQIRFEGFVKCTWDDIQRMLEILPPPPSFSVRVLGCSYEEPRSNPPTATELTEATLRMRKYPYNPPVKCLTGGLLKEFEIAALERPDDWFSPLWNNVYVRRDIEENSMPRQSIRMLAEEICCTTAPEDYRHKFMDRFMKVT